MLVEKTITRIRTSPLLRLVFYYSLLAAVLILLVRALPTLHDLLVVGTSNPPIGQLTGDQAFGDVPPPERLSILEAALRGFLALVGSFLFVAPVTWIYTITKRQEGYDRSFVQMMVILPIVVAGVVRVVRGDLALAFALAGIVAAVRFRTTVRDLKNAVFAFSAIGIGLASGTGGWVLAALLSAVTSFVAFVLWRFNVGGINPKLARHVGPVRLSEALVPGEAHRTVAVGDEGLVAPLSSKELATVPPKVKRLAHYIRADALRKKKKYNTLILVYTLDRNECERAMEKILTDHAFRWYLVEIFAGRYDTTILEYLVRLKDDVDTGALLDDLKAQQDGIVCAAELKPVKGLRKRIT